MPFYGGPAPTDWPSLVGSRLLIRQGYARSVSEVVLVEVSPSREMLKLRYQSGYEGWEEANSIRLVEVLPRQAVTGRTIRLESLG